MPGMDGVEATRRIMANTPCTILIVTVSVGNKRFARIRGNGLRRARRGRYSGARFRRSARGCGAIAGEDQYHQKADWRWAGVRNAIRLGDALGSDLAANIGGHWRVCGRAGRSFRRAGWLAAKFPGGDRHHSACRRAFCRRHGGVVGSAFRAAGAAGQGRRPSAARHGPARGNRRPFGCSRRRIDSATRQSRATLPIVLPWMFFFAASAGYGRAKRSACC